LKNNSKSIIQNPTLNIQHPAQQIGAMPEINNNFERN